MIGKTNNTYILVQIFLIYVKVFCQLVNEQAISLLEFQWPGVLEQHMCLVHTFVDTFTEPRNFAAWPIRYYRFFFVIKCL